MLAASPVPSRLPVYVLASILALGAVQGSRVGTRRHNAAGPAGSKSSAPSVFNNMKEAPPDPILGTTLMFKKDPDPRKINLGVGAYRTQEGKPYLLPVVKKVEEALLAAESAGLIDKEYSTIDGPEKLKAATQKLLFGDAASAVKEGRIASAQALSGTGALRVVAEFVKKHLPEPAHTVYLSDPTWGNHKAIFEAAGFAVKTYPYWDAQPKALDFIGMKQALLEMPSGSTVLLHACAHNPTGIDPSDEQWKEIVETVKAKDHFVVLDSAYQGYASGDLDKDAYAARLFERSGIEFVMAQSFAKNLGLYGERIGMIHVITKNADRAKVVLSQLKLVIRPMYSSPPIHGAHIVMGVLGDPANFAQWRKELKQMADRILSVRSKLRKGLEAKGTPGTWQHITEQIGMFSFTGLSKEACLKLISDHHIYLLTSGRISLAGLNDNNIQYMVDSVDTVVRSLSS